MEQVYVAFYSEQDIIAFLIQNEILLQLREILVILFRKDMTW